jgi:hypothetical protein
MELHDHEYHVARANADCRSESAFAIDSYGGAAQLLSLTTSIM